MIVSSSSERPKTARRTSPGTMAVDPDHTRRHPSQGRAQPAVRSARFDPMAALLRARYAAAYEGRPCPCATVGQDIPVWRGGRRTITRNVRFYIPTTRPAGNVRSPRSTAAWFPHGRG